MRNFLKNHKICAKGIDEMVYSDDRKLALSGWLKKHNPTSYEAPLKLQKFLFLYEAASKADHDEADLSGLKGYQRGPVFSRVWGDYTKDRAEFDAKAEEKLSKLRDIINVERAEKISFITSVLSEEELSDITHFLNIWKCKESRIKNREPQVALSENDLNENDKNILRQLEDLYSLDLIRSSKIICINDMFFVFDKNNIKNLTEEHMDTLCLISKNEDLHNPVFIEIDKDGGLTID